ncbi:hypothetical protein [Nocardia testacea]|uniref:hypothetical protein n=1 Tax=Nocardia testacea TaxID=248551 RepID=UPI003A8A0EE6
MITVLAQQAAQASNPWWSFLAVPVGAVTGAVIAGGASWVVSRKTPYDRLEQLIGVAKDWPDDLPGKDTVYQAVELTLGEIRRADRLGELPKASTEPDKVTAAEEKIDGIVQQRALGSARSMVLSVAVATVVGLVGLVVFLANDGGTDSPWVPLLISATVAAGGMIFTETFEDPIRYISRVVAEGVIALLRQRRQVHADGNRTAGASPGEAGERPDRDEDATEEPRQVDADKPSTAPASEQPQPAPAPQQ